VDLRKERPKMPKLLFKIPEVWAEETPSGLAWNIVLVG
jgi:hypothetical protein